MEGRYRGCWKGVIKVVKKEKTKPRMKKRTGKDDVRAGNEEQVNV